MAKPDKQLDNMLKRHRALTHSTDMKVCSHVQRETDEWVVHTLMLESIDVPFVFKRKKRYKPLVGANVNLTYYPSVREVAGIAMEQMNVVRVKRA